MKYIFTLFLISYFSTQSISQDSTIALSQFEHFSSQPNRIIKKEMQPIGKFGWHSMNTFKSTDMVTGAAVYAIRMGKYNTGDMPHFVNPLSTYIDFVDLDSVIYVLNTFLEESKKPNPEKDVQFSYITANDVEFSAYFDVSNSTWQYTMGKLYRHLRTYVPGSINHFNSRRFAEFVALLKEASVNRW